jgi:DNA-binding NarL/FixJ family response regulator
MKKILLVDENNVIIEGIKSVLTAEGFDFKYFTANNRREALKILSQNKINLLFTNICIPKEYNSKSFEFEGLELISYVESFINKPKIIVTIQNVRIGLIKKLFSLSVNGIVIFSQLYEEVSVALKLIESGKKYFSPTLNTVDENCEINIKFELTVFQEYIMRLLAEGRSNDEISFLINRSVRSVERNLNELRYLFDSKTNPQLIAKAFRLGIID